MKGDSNRSQGQSGVSLIETLVVIAIIVVVAGLALMQRGSANAQFQRQNVARELKVAFERARFDSVKRRAIGGAPQAFVTVTPTSYTLRTYKNDVNGAAVANDLVTNLPTGIVIARYDGVALTSFAVNFNMRGETSASPAPQFYVCNTACTSPTTANANIVLVTPTGTVNLLGGDAAPPVFVAPNVTNVAAGTGVSNMVAVP